MLHLQSPQFLPLPLPTSRRLRRSCLLRSGAGDSLRKLPESCYSYGIPVLRRNERTTARKRRRSAYHPPQRRRTAGVMRSPMRRMPILRTSILSARFKESWSF